MLEEEVRLKNLEIEVIKEQHEETVSSLQLSFEKEKEAIVSELSLQIEAILRDKLDDCCKFEQVVKGKLLPMQTSRSSERTRSRSTRRV